MNYEVMIILILILFIVGFLLIYIYSINLRIKELEYNIKSICENNLYYDEQITNMLALMNDFTRADEKLIKCILELYEIKNIKKEM
jgi:hypothetical protein